VVEIRLQVPGRRNVLAALAVVAACARLDVPPQVIKQGLEEFTGVSRDFESRGSYRGVTLIDDDGDSPTAVGHTLRLGRRVFGERRIWAVLVAPWTSLSSEARTGYIAALALADEVVLARGATLSMPVRNDPVRLANRTKPLIPLTTATGIEPGATEAEALVGALLLAGVRARSVASLDDAIMELDRHLEPGDVLVTLGAGDVGTISDAFFRRLPRDRPGR
jgi:UDP-N-acetylmuramate--alanine ligase